MNQPMPMTGPEEIVVSEPYVFSAVSTLIGSPVVIETTRGRISGMLMDGKPDPLIIKVGDSTFFVRLCEVVWIMPDPLKR
ncbi:YuzF family protein [Bacillus mesophilus]|uniref:YuzF family protein n=2 Tax=Bacillus mesophilus TaxID=1808955 RepID=A0A6M0Q9K7_9BACI|nr:YuzF family protein [Bacillus mesophilus]